MCQQSPLARAALLPLEALGVHNERYSCLLIDTYLKVNSEARMEPLIHTEYL